QGRRPRAADFAVAPRLGSDPLESIFAVARLGPTLIMEDDGMMALGLKSAAQVLSHEGISLAVELGGFSLETVLVIRRPRYDDRKRRLALRQIDRGGQLGAVCHGHHEVLALKRTLVVCPKERRQQNPSQNDGSAPA